MAWRGLYENENNRKMRVLCDLCSSGGIVRMDFLPDCEFVVKEKVPFRSIWKSFYKSLPESALLSGEYVNGIGKEREKAFDQW